MKNVAGYDEYYNINTAKNNTCSFFKLPKILFIDEKLKNLSPEAKILYSILCDLTSLSSKNGWIDENGNIYVRYSVKKTGETLGCKKDKAMKILAELEGIGGTGLIRRKKQGQGNTDMIFVKKIKEETAEEDSQEVSAELEKQTSCGRKNRPLKAKKTTCRDQKNASLEFEKTDTINTNINKTELSKTNLINQDTDQGMTEGTEDYNTHKNVVRKKLEYGYLMQECASDEQAHVDAMVEILTQVEYCPSEGDYIINKTRYPSQIVREQLAKVTRDHVEYVLENLRKSATNITNIRNYLLSSLFNAVNMMDSHYSIQVRHEMAAGDMFARLENILPDCSDTASEELQPWKPS